jgi:N-acetylglucosaminyldiphosphoundecaprenol N-acetyl-beta-D-mannosaminyltransferase
VRTDVTELTVQPPEEHLRTVPSDRVELFGVPVDALTMTETVARCRVLARDGGPHQHVVLNAAKVVELSTNDRLRDIVRSCSVVNADGASVVWASRVLDQPVPERVAGIDLFGALVAAAEADGSSIFLLGAQARVVERVAEILRSRHPELRIAGTADGFWTSDDEIVATIRAARPDYLFLAIPSPRKEYWLSEHLDDLGVPFVMGVGGSFDVVAGVTTRAPGWMQRVGLEWFWRFAQEPRRMWKRYLVGNAKFIGLTLAEWRRRR